MDYMEAIGTINTGMVWLELIVAGSARLPRYTGAFEDWSHGTAIGTTCTNTCAMGKATCPPFGS